MSASFWSAFFNDTRTQVMLLLVALDLLIGVLAAIFASGRAGKFGLSFLADFGRNDLIGKVLPFIIMYAGYKYASGADIVIPGFDMEVVMDAMWVIVLAALVGSLLSSLKQLNIPIVNELPPTLAGPDPASPSPSTTSEVSTGTQG